MTPDYPEGRCMAVVRGGHYGIRWCGSPLPCSIHPAEKQLPEIGGATPGAVDAGSSAVPETRPLVYLACPYSHPDRAVRVARFEAANAAAGKLMREGHKVFSPISHTHPIAEAGGLPLGWDYWEAFDRAYIGNSHKLIVLRVGGWDKSTGVAAEIGIATEYGIPVEYIDPATVETVRLRDPSEPQAKMCPDCKGDGCQCCFGTGEVSNGRAAATTPTPAQPEAAPTEGLGEGKKP